MPKICYREKNFRAGTLALIQQADEILLEQYERGYRLTLRQLYYQFVSKGIIENTTKSYTRLKETINYARLAGLIDWTHMVDRTRRLEGWASWENPEELLQENADTYAVDRWKKQTYRLEVWVEKDALADVVMQACRPWQVPYFSCRGYTSQSALWEAGNRLDSYVDEGYDPVIIHLGDHDPSGLDMTRDILDRCKLFMGGLPVERIALTIDQIQEFKLPPNPTKRTDSRAPRYVRKFGNDSWELDALDPDYIKSIIEDKIQEYIDFDPWNEALEKEEEGRSYFQDLANGTGE